MVNCHTYVILCVARLGSNTNYYLLKKERRQTGQSVRPVLRMRLRYFIIAFFLLIGILFWGVGIYTDWLWFANLGYGEVFLTVFFTEWAVRLVAWLLFFLFLFFNLLFLRSAILNLPNLELREKIIASPLGRWFTPGKITFLFLLASLIISFLFTSYTGNLWLEVRQFFQASSFNISEPIFGQDASFYVFALPFLRALYTFLQSMVMLTILAVGVIYFMINPPVQVGRRIILLPYRGQAHLSLLLALSFLLKAGDYRLQMYELLFSPRGVTFGPGYADLNANLPVLWVLLFMAVAVAMLLVLNAVRRNNRLVFAGIAVLVFTSIGAGSIYPSLVQQFRVDPNEFVFERPFLEHNIEMTLKAYALDDAQAEDYPVLPQISWDSLDEASGTIDNVRLWDYRPLRQTYNQLQGIRPYYEFVDVDTDRYYLDGEYRQVMLAARELNTNNLPEQAQTWVNLRLLYTHGYGLAMSPVARVTAQGLPDFVIGDVPVVTEAELEVDRPEVYYGEISTDFVIVNTNTPEMNYPKGDANVFTHYEGEGGVQLQSFLHRLLFALKFSDYRVLISGEIHPESRIMFNRSIRDRVNRIAPFLRYDQDPYLVLADGRLQWIIDAYTTSGNFPYAQPTGNINYMRNPVKVVVDAYHGHVDFYVVDPEDPIITTYGQIFPGLFKPFEEMPASLQEHIRYPETYFNIQTQVYATYHMTDPGVFYNREDLWQVPSEKYFGATQPVEPYYTVLQLPGEDEAEFVLMKPFTPARRDNMIAWIAGRSDGENYGELLVYEFPKDRVIFGPMQIETRIDQNPLISQQLTLWDQRGSRAIRGNLLVLPINGAILYVEPVFLQADQSELPELVRVIAGFGETVVMEPTLEEALVSLFGEREAVPVEPPEEDRPVEPEPVEPTPPEITIPQTLQELAGKAQELYEEAQVRQRDGDWAGYGRALDELERVLNDLVAGTAETVPLD